MGCLLLPLPLLSQSQQDGLTDTVYFYEDGSKSSEGHLRDGRPDGYWTNYYRNGNVKAEGNRKNFELDSTWVFYNRDGSISSKINYLQGVKHGERLRYEEGEVVKREFFDQGRIVGYAKHYYPSGQLKKEVPYEEGEQQGTGYAYNREGRIVTLLTYKNGQLIRKQDINQKDDQRQKQGVWMDFHKNRNIAKEGPYVNDLKNGYWKYYKSNGDLLRVEKWEMGELQEGASETAKVEIRREMDPKTGKQTFKGAYRNGEPEGVHRYYNPDGTVKESYIYESGVKLYEGILDEQGRKQGLWKAFYRSGELKSKGHYKDDLKIGDWEYYYEDGSVEQEGSYMRGQPDGTWTWYHPNGQELRVEEYAFGKEDGASVEYNDTGKVIAKGEYIDGQREGQWFFEQNDHRAEGSYFEGERTGKWRYFDTETGQLRFEGQYENGLRNGTFSHYYPNGQLQRRGDYRNDKRHGIWEFFTEKGQRIITIEYEEGEEVKYDGNRIRYNRRYRKAMEAERAEANAEEE